MEKKNINWAELGFGYMPTDYRYYADWKDGKWSEGRLTTDNTVTMSECAGVIQYAQTCFEGLKAYTQKDGSIVTFRPDLNAQRMQDSARRLLMPEVSTEMFLHALDETVKANAAWVPPYGTGATLYVRPCDAVDNLPQLAQRMGLDAGEAQAELQRQLQRPPASME